MTRPTQHLHEKRGITFQEMGALLGVREMLARGLLKDPGALHEDGAHDFNMNIPCRLDGHCGTVACIGGTMALLMGQLSPSRYVAGGGLNGKLGRLFYPDTALVQWQSITPAQAVRAIDNWLDNGNPRWRSATSD